MPEWMNECQQHREFQGGGMGFDLNSVMREHLPEKGQVSTNLKEV